MSYKPAWSQPALEITELIIHLQNVLMTGIGHCSQDITIEDYRQFKTDIGALPFVAALISESCDALFSLKKNKRGKKPLWFEWGEDIKFFSLEVQRAMPAIEKDRRGNNWELIQCRLGEMNLQCVDLKKKILKIIPEEEREQDDQINVSQKSAIEWTGLAKTLESGGDYVLLANGGFRYKKRWN